MSNAEKEYQKELKNMTEEELLYLVNHYRELSFNLQSKLDNASGRCKECNSPLNYSCWYCKTPQRKEI